MSGIEEAPTEDLYRELERRQAVAAAKLLAKHTDFSPEQLLNEMLFPERSGQRSG